MSAKGNDAEQSASPSPDRPDVIATPSSAPSAASVPPARSRTRRQKLTRWALYLAALMVGAGITSASWWMSCGYSGCPSVGQLRAWRPTEGGELLDRNGTLVGPLTPVRRVNVPLTRVPAHVKAAFIAVEDRRFYKHHGIDWQGVARATLSNLKAGGVREGGSTISMQLARNVFLSSRASERSFTRKFLEIRYARLLERALSKDQILERYLNAIYLGNGVYGVEGASRDLFGKGVNDVSLAEAAMLAGLPKAPSGYSPRRDRERARARRDVVFDVLAREHVASAAEIDAARRTPLTVSRMTWEPTRNVDSWAMEAVRYSLDSLRKAGEIPVDVPDGSLVIYSTIDRKAQSAAERAVAWGAYRADQMRNEGGGPTQGALVALDPSTGAIRAIVGGRRVERKGFNRAVRAQRQPGSAFKPFVYAAALMHGFTAASMVEDEPITIGEGRYEWTPANYDGEYSGRVTLRDALTRSANAATVRVSRDVGIDVIAEQAHAQGIRSTLPLVPALALGAGGVTPLELTAAYAPFANGGSRVTPYMIDRIEDNLGRVLWDDADRSTARAIESPDAFLVTSLMQSVVDHGTGYAVRQAGIRGPVAGKTGTTNDGADVWFVGFTPSIVAGIWFGADDPVSLGGGASGGRIAAPAWARFIKEGWHSPERDPAWQVPLGIEEKQIDIGTGKLASDWCGPSRREYFRIGTTPTESCESDAHLAMWDTLAIPDWTDVPPPDSGGRQISDAVNAVMRALQRSETGREVSRRVVSEIRRAVTQETKRARQLEKRVAERIERDRERGARNMTRNMERQMEQHAEAMARAAERLADARRARQ